MMKRSIYVGLVVSALVTVFAVHRAHAIIIVNSQPVEFGPMSLARGEVFRFYIGNPDLDTTAPVCQASVMVYDQMGTMVAQSQTSALPGQIGFFDVAFDVFARKADASRIHMPGVNNVAFRAVAQVVSPGTASETAPGPPDCVLTAEVFDTATGKAAVFIGNPDLLPAAPTVR